MAKVVEHNLPQLGTGPGWLLSILRDRCWMDPQSGMTRSQVAEKGGYAGMAGWLGLSRPMTIYEWLREPVWQIYLQLMRPGLRLQNREQEVAHCSRELKILAGS